MAASVTGATLMKGSGAAEGRPVLDAAATGEREGGGPTSCAAGAMGAALPFSLPLAVPGLGAVPGLALEGETASLPEPAGVAAGTRIAPNSSSHSLRSKHASCT